MKCAFLHDRPTVAVAVADHADDATGSARRIKQGLRLSRALGCIAALAIMAGCATQTPPRAVSPSSAGAAVNSEYQGRFSVRYADQTQRIQNAYGNFDWLEQGDVVTLSLRSPLGNTLAIVGSTPTQARLELPNQAPRTASNVEDLMRGALGFPLPVSGMRYWLKNTPAPDAQAQLTRDKAGRITQIVQDGWRIDYLAFADNPSPAAPAVSASASSAPAGFATTGAARAATVLVRRMNLTRIDAPSDAPLDVRLVLNP